LEDSQQALNEFELKLRRCGLEVGQEPLPEPTHDHSDEEMTDAPAARPVPAAESSKPKHKKQTSFRNAVPQKKIARKDLTREQIEAASIDLTMDDDTPHAAAASSSAAAAASGASSHDELKSVLTSTSSKGRKRLPTSLSVESDDASPPAKRRPRKSAVPSAEQRAPSPIPVPSTDSSSTSSPAASSGASSAASTPTPTQNQNASTTKQTSLASFFTAPTADADTSANSTK
jgi:hypothetical protein